MGFHILWPALLKRSLFLCAMSIRLPPPASVSDPISDSESHSSSSESDDDDDQTWDDWVSDSNAQQQCKSLFEDKVFPSVEAALAYDKEAHQFSLEDICTALCELTWM